MLIGALLLSSVALAVPCGAEHLTGTSPNAYGAPTDSPLVLHFQGCDEAANVPVKVVSNGAAGTAVALSTTIEAVPGCTVPLTVSGGWAPSTRYLIEVGETGGTRTRMQFRTGDGPAGTPGNETIGELTCDPERPTMPERPKGERDREFERGSCIAYPSETQPESALTFSCATSAGSPGAAFGVLALLAIRRRSGGAGAMRAVGVAPGSASPPSAPISALIRSRRR